MFDLAYSHPSNPSFTVALKTSILIAIKGNRLDGELLRKLPCRALLLSDLNYTSLEKLHLWDVTIVPLPLRYYISAYGSAWENLSSQGVCQT